MEKEDITKIVAYSLLRVPQMFESTIPDKRFFLVEYPEDSKGSKKPLDHV